MREGGFLRLPILLTLMVLLVGAAATWYVVAGRGQPPPAAPGSPLLLVVLDVGQADSIFVRSPAGRTMLVDAGNGRGDVEQAILPHLRRLGVSSLDYVVLSHPDQDHVGGMPTLLDSLPVSAFVDSVQPGVTNQTYRRTLQQVQSKGIKAVSARRNQTQLDLGAGITVEVLGPEEPLITTGDSPENANAVVLRLTYGSVSALLAADIEPETEERLVAHGGEMRSQILKVAHHGSRESSTPRFLDAVRPEVALISAGAGNPYGHPHRELLQRLERRGVKIYRTDLHGTIEVSVDGSGYRVTAEKRGG